MLRMILALLNCMLFCPSIFATSTVLQGDWSGTYCSNYNDGLSYGTYNWNFSFNTVTTYIQYYKNRISGRCEHPIGQSTQAHGTYQLNGTELIVQFIHLSYPLKFKAEFNGNDLWMTNLSNGSIKHLVKK